MSPNHILCVLSFLPPVLVLPVVESDDSSISEIPQRQPEPVAQAEAGHTGAAGGAEGGVGGEGERGKQKL